MSFDSKSITSFAQIPKFRGERVPSERDISYEAWSKLIVSGFEANGWTEFIQDGYDWDSKKPAVRELESTYLLSLLGYKPKKRERLTTVFEVNQKLWSIYKDLKKQRAAAYFQLSLAIASNSTAYKIVDALTDSERGDPLVLWNKLKSEFGGEAGASAILKSAVTSLAI